jgi:hypothetical protein
VKWRDIVNPALLTNAKDIAKDVFGRSDVPSDEDGLIRFVIDTLDRKRQHYINLLEHEYNRDSYPEEDIVKVAHDLMNDILSQSKDNVALLNRLIAKQEQLLNSTEDMESVDTFFKPESQQKVIFDTARQLEKDLRNERDYFVADTETLDRIKEITTILAMPKPYMKIKDLPGIIQDIKTAYNTLLELKKDEVNGMIIQCMGDVHTLAGVGIATQEVRKADERFTEFKQKVAESTSLTHLDAMIMQLLNFKDTVCRHIESILNPQTHSTTSGDLVPMQSIMQLRRYEAFPVKRIQSREDVDNYVELIRKKLYKTLESCDGIQIN